MQNDFAQGGNVLFLEINSKWELYLMTSFSLWLHSLYEPLDCYIRPPTSPPHARFSAYPFTNRKSYSHILPLGSAIWPLATSQNSSHTTPPCWLCSRYGGQDLSFLRPFHSLSFPLGTLCSQILHIFFLTFMSQLHIISLGNYPN